MPTILAIESTCDETGAAVVVDGVRRSRSNIVASQVELHARYLRGVVAPEIASRACISKISCPSFTRQSLESAGCGLASVDAIAVAHRPGLIGSLLIGVTAAKTLAWSVRKPLIGIDHVHAHLYSVMLQPDKTGVTSRFVRSGARLRTIGGSFPFLSSANADIKGSDPFMTATVKTGNDPFSSAPAFPAIGLVCSGGHTAIYRVNDWTDVAAIGRHNHRRRRRRSV